MLHFTDNTYGLDISSSGGSVNRTSKVDIEEQEEKKVPDLPVKIESAQQDTKAQAFKIVSTEDWVKEQLGITGDASEKKSSNSSNKNIKITRDRSDTLPDGITMEDIENASKELEKEVEIKDINTSFTWDPEEMRKIEERKIYNGDLSYEEYTNMNEEGRPERVEGDLLFADCKSVKGLSLPKRVDGSVHAEGLESAEEVNLLLSQITEINGHLYIKKDIDRMKVDIRGVKGMLFSQ